jgi:NCS1 family nucleobase:cation symporter-1
MVHVDVDCATFASNAANFQRYARESSDVIPGSIIGFLIANFIVGNLVCASSQVIFGELMEFCRPP